VPDGPCDPAGDIEDGRRIGIAAVEDAGPAPRRDHPNELADVGRRRRVEEVRAAHRQEDVRAPVERTFHEEPLARQPVAGAIDRARPDDRRRDTSVLEEPLLDRRLLRRVVGGARLEGGLRLGDRPAELRELVLGFRLVKRPALIVRVDRRARDRDDRADVELEQLVGVGELEGNDVDDQVEAVRRRERPLLVAVEMDDRHVLEARRRGRFPAREHDRPAVAEEAQGDRAADVARAAEHERVAGQGTKPRRRRRRRRSRRP
jgi:hypothetical protein